MSHRWQTYAAQFWRARRRHISKCDDGQLLTTTNNPIVVRLNISIIRILVAIATRLSAFAFLLLAEAGMKGWYIKLRLRWLSDCFEVYIRNTKIIVSQHIDVLSSSNERLAAVAIAPANLPPNIAESGILDDSFYVLEDDD